MTSESSNEKLSRISTIHLRQSTIDNRHRPWPVMKERSLTLRPTVLFFQVSHLGTNHSYIHLLSRAEVVRSQAKPSKKIQNKNRTRSTNMSLKATEEDDSPKLGLAIVGCGQIVTHHIEAMASALAGKLELRALCDPSEARRKAIQDLVTTRYADQLLVSSTDGSRQLPQQFERLDEILSTEKKDFLASQIDVIFIAVPHDLHETIAMQALSTNKIVVMEKPLAPKRDACERLVKVSEDLLANASSSSSGATPEFIIAEQSPYWQEVDLACKLITEGQATGKVVTAASYFVL